MQEVLIDIDEISDSKEVYDQKPKPMLAGFVYFVLSIFLIALVYCFVGSIEVTSTGSGVVRPNDKVNTISNAASGVIQNVNYSDGDLVNEGDILLQLDTADQQKDLDKLLAEQKRLTRQLELNQKYLESINAKENKFESDPSSDEYEFYIKYEYYATSSKEKEATLDFEQAKDSLNIDYISDEVTRLNKEITELSALKNSVEQKENLVQDSNLYNYQYLLYESSLESISNNYDQQKQKIQSDITGQSTNLSHDYYSDQLKGYKMFLESVKKEEDKFSKDDQYRKMYEEYNLKLDEYNRLAENAQEKYDLLKESMESTDSDNPLLEYHATMLEGYQYFRQSVETNQNMFDPNRSGYNYQYLYQDYIAEYNNLASDYSENMQRLSTQEDIEPGEIVVSSDLSRVSSNDAANDLRQRTLAQIDNKIMELQASIAEIKINLNSTITTEYDVSSAEVALKNAKDAVEAYKLSTIKSIEENISQLELKQKEAKLSQSLEVSKETLLADLDKTLSQSQNETKTTLLKQTEDALQTKQSTLESHMNDLNQLQRTQSYYSNNVTDQNELIPVAQIRLNALQQSVDTIQSLKTNLDEVSHNIAKLKISIDNSTIKAPQSGIINSLAELVEGDLLQSGTTMATIIPPEESQFNVQIYIDNKDIAGVKPGNTIKYNIGALPSSQYGVLEGTVQSVSRDTKLQQDGSSSGYYLVEATLNNEQLYDKNGNEAEIAVGMALNSKIVTQEKKIIFYLMEKIDLF